MHKKIFWQDTSNLNSGEHRRDWPSVTIQISHRQHKTAMSEINTMITGDKVDTYKTNQITSDDKSARFNTYTQATQTIQNTDCELSTIYAN